MIPEIGQFSLVLALGTGLLLSVMPLLGSFGYAQGWMRTARPGALLMLFLVTLSYLALTWSFMADDFSVAYVANNSNRSMPLIYKISGVWGGHEGSILFWVFILSLWTGAVALFSRALPDVLLARVLSVLGMVTVGFLLFVLLTSNPFERLTPVPPDGASLNPLLQDPGMAAHPPLLYMGYVGFAVTFAFAIAALIGGRLDSATLRWMRPWANIAWMFLTFGIALGSYWAYYELGWGGWWFWDPVENASFMPWLVGTALIHSIAATEKRGVFQAWTVLLAVLAFSLSLLGTFLVRSGVLSSVHAFATDPTRGLFILLFLGFVIGGSLTLYSFRAHRLRGQVAYEPISRESGLLLNNVLMVVACAAVLLGTLYPLFVDALGMGKISVGAQYFNAVFVPLMVPVMLFVGIGSVLNWKRDRLQKRALWQGMLMVLSVALGLYWASQYGSLRIGAAAGIALSIWVLLSSLYAVAERAFKSRNPLMGLIKAPGAFWGMVIAHTGIGVFALGVALVSAYSDEQMVRMAPGDEHEVMGYRFVFDTMRETPGPNWVSAEGVFSVTRDDMPVATLYTQKRTYDVRRETMTEAGINGSMTRDLFIALGQPLENRMDGDWEVRLQVKPFIRWIWLGTVLMGIGGLVAALDKRYRLASRRATERAARSQLAGDAFGANGRTVLGEQGA